MAALANHLLDAGLKVAVHGFLDGRIGFLDIVSVVETTVERIARSAINSLDDVIAIDTEARSVARDLIGTAGTLT